MTKTKRSSSDSTPTPTPTPIVKRGTTPTRVTAGGVVTALPLAAPLPRPMARATRIALFEREVRERLSPSALELLMSRAEVISEGQRGTRGGRDIYQGSTMLTLDLAALGHAFRDACDAGTARRLATLLAADTSVPARIQIIAEKEATRLCKAAPRRVESEFRVHSQGIRVFIDVDVEATF